MGCGWRVGLSVGPESVPAARSSRVPWHRPGDSASVQVPPLAVFQADSGSHRVFAYKGRHTQARVRAGS